MLVEYRFRLRPEQHDEVSVESSGDELTDIYDSESEDFNIFDMVDEEELISSDEEIENLNKKKLKTSNSNLDLDNLPVSAQVEDSVLTPLKKAVRFADAAIQALNQLDQRIN